MQAYISGYKYRPHPNKFAKSDYWVISLMPWKQSQNSVGSVPPYHPPNFWVHTQIHIPILSPSHSAPRQLKEKASMVKNISSTYSYIYLNDQTQGIITTQAVNKRAASYRGKEKQKIATGSWWRQLQVCLSSKINLNKMSLKSCKIFQYFPAWHCKINALLLLQNPTVGTQKTQHLLSI